MSEEMHGFLAAKNLDIDCLGKYEDMGHFKQYNALLNKFLKDQVFLNGDDQVSFLDGYIYNKDIIMQNASEDWQYAFAHAMKQDAEGCLKTLRGGFCGYIYNKMDASLTIYTDHVSVKALYYYVDGERWIISNHIAYMVDVLKANKAAYSLNEVAVQYMLTYGYMLDDSTFVKEIHRLLPGQIVYINNGAANIKRYYMLHAEEKQMSIEEAVEKIDVAFRQAVGREFEKDKEYGCQHLVDLSGGLDSRMVSWVAHDMGYTNQLNVTVSQANYYDDKISKRVAHYLNNEYLFKALDDIEWMYDIDEMIVRNNGAALYTGPTGDNRLLGILNTKKFGIKHTGMVGDAVLSTFYHNKDFNYGKPQLGLHRYSELLTYEFDEKITQEYSWQEMFAIYTRGILCAQSSYMISQHYLETASPFMDVDFLETAFSIPFEYRNKHYIYLKWMEKKYPKATEFGWEKWGGVKPKNSYILFRKMKTLQRLTQRVVCKLLNIEDTDNMNPMDFWYQKNEKMKEYYNIYYTSNINNVVINEALRNDISMMFQKGNVIEKSMALTVLAIIRRYYG